jgi:nitrogen PTS system EIIA component
MDYAKIFKSDGVTGEIQAVDVEGVLEELVHILSEAEGLPKSTVKDLRLKIQEKLQMGATGAIGHGVAVPHIKLPSVKHTMAVFGRSQKSVDFQAGDGIPVNLFFFVVGPLDAPEEHLGFMRWVAAISRDKDFRSFAAACGGKKDLHELLREMSPSS